MAQKVFEKQIDVKSEEILHIGNVVQNDTDANIFVLALIDNNSPVDISDATVTFTVKRPDGYIIIDGAGDAAKVTDGAGGVVTVKLFHSAISVSGRCLATAEVYRGTTRVTTARMSYTVTAELGGSTDISKENEYPILTELIKDVQGIDGEAKECAGLALEYRDSAAASAAAALESKNLADGFAQGAGVSEENAGKSAELAGSKAGEAAELAKAAESSANAALVSAGEASGSAEAASSSLGQAVLKASEAAASAAAASDSAKASADSASASSGSASAAEASSLASASSASAAEASSGSAASSASAAGKAKEDAQNAAGQAAVSLASAEAAKESASGFSSAAAASASAAKGSAESASASASAAGESAKAAGVSASAAASSSSEAAASDAAAGVSAKDAAASAVSASSFSSASESWAVGGTGTRQGEDSNNAKYWAEQAQAIAGGDYPTRVEMNAALSDKVDKETGKGLSSNDYTASEKAKLSGIAENANNYVHPSTHAAGMIVEDASRRFVSDAEKAAWNGKLDKSGGTLTGVLMLSSDPTVELQAATKQYVDTALGSYAVIESPVFTGSPAAPTAATDTNSTQIATTAFAHSLVDENRDVLNVTYDVDSFAVVAEAVSAGKIVICTRNERKYIYTDTVSDGVKTCHRFTAVYATNSAGDNASEPGIYTMRLDNDDSWHYKFSVLLPNSDPVLKGVPTAPTAAAGTNTTQIATTAFVADAVASNTGRTYTVTLGAWQGDFAPYQQQIAVPGITAEDDPFYDVIIGDDYEMNQTCLAEFSKIYGLTTGNGNITLYAVEPTLATLNLQLILKVVG